MKLLNLKISAFGPFYKEEYIDFEQFEESKIFLISGKTGSGKTTIFDAISYALFGKLTGEFKSELTTRSHYVNKNITTYVELVFEANNKKYKVKRKPSYFVEGKKTITKPETILELMNTNQILSTKQAEVNKLIEDIIGFKYEQFKQIVVLPQGEFIKILNSKSKDKEELLSAILDTSIYSLLSKRIKEDCDEVNKKIELVTTQLDSILETYKLNNIDELKELLNVNRINEHNINKDLENLNLIIKDLNDKKLKYEIDNKNIIRLEDIRKELEELINNYPNINDQKLLLKKLKKYKEVSIYFKEIEKNTVLIQKYIKMLEDIDNNLIILNNNKEKIQLLDKELLELKNKEIEINLKIEGLTKIKTKITELKKYNLSLEENIRLLKEYNNKEVNLKITYNETIKKLNEYTSIYKKTLDYINQYSIDDYLYIENTYNKFQKKIEIDKNINDNLKLIDEYKELINNIKIEIDESNNQYEHYFKIFMNNILYSYKDKIIENEPCPLCGSIHHPNIIEPADTIITEEYIEKLNKEILRLNNKLKSYEEKILSFINKINELKKIKEYSIDMKEYDVFIIQYNEAIKKHKTYNDYKLKISSYEKNVNDYETKKKNIEKEISNIDVEIVKINKDNDNINIKINELELEINNQLVGNDINKLEEEYILSLKNVKNRISEINNILNNHYISLNKLENDKKNCINNINNSNNQISEYNDLINKILITKEEYESYNLYKNQINELSSLESIISNYDNDFLRLKTEEETYVKLVKDCSFVDTDIIIKEINEKTNIRNDINKKYLELFSFNTSLSDDINKYIKLEKSIETDYKKYMMLKELNDLCSGNIKGVKKTSLQRYILIKLLDEILCYANTYLTHFTSNRYTLVLDNSINTSTSGLELSVIDDYTGTIRGVGSLSGGESFLSALALALGMSECIMNMYGGIKMDNIFIDEGFGSLDQDSLTNAIEALIDLANNGRLIGIISHVEDIKAMIPTSIDVVKTNNGSYLKIEI